MVGAVADWFAVVALFRRPLGLPIAHTAIIPNNKDRIGESLGRFVEENFLTPENVMQRLARVNIAKACGTWLAEPANSDRAADGICAMLPRVVAMIEDEDSLRNSSPALCWPSWRRSISLPSLPNCSSLSRPASSTRSCSTMHSKASKD